MDVKVLLDTVKQLQIEEFHRIRKPFELAHNEELEERLGPLVRPRGTPTKEKLQQRYR